ncbi:hypothetical protein KPH14_002761 [Odynerus spinipes]|uniref:Replication protein A 14 kDa subunit n=1 Tax=Odynerus spinipes TaxID=1348599 RepID=A0AAD9RLU9_9HYME|nr:hypothetical protein KPH14_002761 [Odynerus spinipes]
MKGTLQKRIDGRNLAKHLGDQVILLGTIKRKGANGKNIELLTTDGVQVNVTLNEALDVNAEGYIEIHGTAQSSSTVLCSYYILFPSYMTATFSEKQYNEYLVLANILGPKTLIQIEDCLEG